MTEQSTKKGCRVEVHNLVVKFGERYIIPGMTLIVEPGEFVVLLGPSGCGKSTLIRTIVGIQTPDEGKILLNGNNSTDRGTGTFRPGYVPQDDIIHLDLPVEKVLYYSARLRIKNLSGRDDDSYYMEIVDSILNTLELTAHRQTLVRYLSGGQRKRVSIGVELITRPSLITMDEPTSGLDPALEEKMMELCRHMSRENCTVLVTTHAMESVDLADNVLILSAGCMTYFGPPAEAPAWFGAENLGDIFRVLSSTSPDKLGKKFIQSSYYEKLVRARSLKSGSLKK
ncbi:MAG: ABC transporter ATP-binding protein [Candidatus Riflebacteria bacterium]|nr:ABC transporter ATP-binding protein [Candidatus Riflebacteria bacterium]